ncbi:MAG: hypothetical protein ACLFR1_04570 [Spirochaetia bacterium]
MLLFLLCSGCSLDNPYIDVIRGNYYTQKGAYQQAIVNYLDALDSNTFVEYINFNLGNVYRSQGESEAALQIWEEAETENHEDLYFALHYNRGTLFYEMTRYRDAYREFRDALQVNPNSIEAKINLEYCLEKIEATAASQEQEQAQTEQSSGSGAQQGTERVLEYIRRREDQQWVSPDTITPETPANDW